MEEERLPLARLHKPNTREGQTSSLLLCCVSESCVLRGRGINLVGGRAIFPEKLHGGRASSKKVRQQQSINRESRAAKKWQAVRKIETIRSSRESSESPCALWNGLLAERHCPTTWVDQILFICGQGALLCLC